MSERSKRHQRRPSQGVFVIPDDLSAPLPDSNIPTSPAQAPAPPREKTTVGGGGVHLPPQTPPSKPVEETPSSDRYTKG